MVSYKLKCDAQAAIYGLVKQQLSYALGVLPKLDLPVACEQELREIANSLLEREI